jgi:hypothetical protein
LSLFLPSKKDVPPSPVLLENVKGEIRQRHDKGQDER